MPVRRTIGTVTKSGQIAHAEIQLGDFKSWSSFRVLGWDVYDIILGVDWLRYWKAIWNREGSKLSLSNGSDKRQSVEMRPFRNIDSEGLKEAGLNLLSSATAKKR